jgi:hypothetical protein
MDWKDRLYFGDNLKILREYVEDARAIVIPANAGIHSGNLPYLDPPFNSSATYNVLFKEKSGEGSAAQIMAFEDTWQWGREPEAVYRDIVERGPSDCTDLMQPSLGSLSVSGQGTYRPLEGSRGNG